jgi:WD40 repeat protein
MSRRRVIVAAVAVWAVIPGCLNSRAPLKTDGDEPLDSPAACKAVYGFSVSSDERWLGYYGTGKAIHLESLPQRKPAASLTYHNLEVQCAVFHPVESSLLACYVDGSVVRWSLVDDAWRPQPLGRHNSGVTCCAISAAGEYFATGGFGGEIAVWALGPNPRIVRTLNHGYSVRSVQFAPDGRQLAAGDEKSRIKLWNTETWTASDVASGHRDAVSVIAYSDDGRFLVTAGYDGVVRMTKRIGDRCVWTVRLTPKRIQSAAFSPDGRALALGMAFSGNVPLLDVQTGRLLGTIPAHKTTVTRVHFLSDGTLMTSSHDGTIRAFIEAQDSVTR